MYNYNIITNNDDLFSLQNSADMNETVSILRWTPKMENDGKILTCRASHEKLPHSTIETTMSLSLHCKLFSKKMCTYISQ